MVTRDVPGVERLRLAFREPLAAAFARKDLAESEVRGGGGWGAIMASPWLPGVG